MSDGYTLDVEVGFTDTDYMVFDGGFTIEYELWDFNTAKVDLAFFKQLQNLQLCDLELFDKDDLSGAHCGVLDTVVNIKRKGGSIRVDRIEIHKSVL
jgi:hypothetical protein